MSGCGAAHRVLAIAASVAMAAAGGATAAVAGATLTAGPAGAGTTPVLSASPSLVQFPETRLGHFRVLTATVTNANANPAQIGGYTTSGEIDFLPEPATLPDGTIDPASCYTIAGQSEIGATIAAGGTCTLAIWFVPTHFGVRSATLSFGFAVNTVDSTFSVNLLGTGVAGYYGAGSPGWFDTIGWAPILLVNDASLHPAAPFTGITGTPTGNGLSLVGADGGVFTFGDAGYYGSMGGFPLAKPIVGIAATPTGRGYWEVAADGGIFAFGNAAYDGSMGGFPLAKPIVGIAATPTGRGYWEVAADGGIFAFGNAPYDGSMSGFPLAKPIVGIAATPTGRGYWEVAADGGIFSFGDARFYGSTGALHLTSPIVSILPSPTGHGYWLAAADGGIFAFGDAPYYGNFVGAAERDTIGIAPTASPLSGFLLIAPAGLQRAAAAVAGQAAAGTLTLDR